MFIILSNTNNVNYKKYKQSIFYIVLCFAFLFNIIIDG